MESNRPWIGNRWYAHINMSEGETTMKWHFVSMLALASVVISTTPVAAGGYPLETTLYGKGGPVAVDVTLKGNGEVCFVANKAISAVEIEEISTKVVVGNIDVSEGLSGCGDVHDRNIIKDIRQNPSDYWLKAGKSWEDEEELTLLLGRLKRKMK